jgi:hypothetical protein
MPIDGDQLSNIYFNKIDGQKLVICGVIGSKRYNWIE